MDRNARLQRRFEWARGLTGLLAGAVVLAQSFAGNADSKVTTLACNEFPPHKMQAAPDGRPGYDVEILREAFRRAGQSIDIVYYPWTRALVTAKAGSVDGLCSCSKRPEREPFFVYSDVMGDVGVGVFLVKGLERKVAAIADLKALSIGVVRAYNLQDELIDLGMTPVVVSSDEQGLRMLLVRRIDGFLTFRDTGKYILGKLAADIDAPYVEFRAAPYFACFSKAVPGAAERVKLFNRGLAAMRADGTYDAILARYR